jgi:RimJ/RimL family protein N-acetyltransferase
MFVRKLSREDWPLYKKIRLEALRLHSDVYGTSYKDMCERPDAEWESILLQEDAAFFGLFDDQTIVGLGGVFTQEKSTRTGMLIAGYIRADYRGRGLSKMIYQARIDWAKESGLFDRLLIGHREGNEASRRANQAFGFQPIGVVDYTFGNGDIAKDYQYELRLR